MNKKEYNLDLTRTVKATNVRMNRQTNVEEQFVTETPLSNFVSQALRYTGSFERAKAVEALVEKVETGKQIKVTEDEMPIVVSIFQRAETKPMNGFRKMVEELNPDFDLVQYEKSLQQP